MTNTASWDLIARDLTDQIASGVLIAGDRLPSEAELARRYGVSRMTLRQALGRLQSDGLVIRRHGAGTFIAQRKQVHRAGNRLGSFHEELGLVEDEIETRVMSVQVMAPPEHVARALDMTATQKAMRFDRLRLLSGQPISLQEGWVPYLIDPGMARESLTAGSLYRTLFERSGIKILRALQEVSASLATAGQAAMLEIEPGSALIDITRISYSTTNVPVVSSHSWTLPQFSLIYELQR